jgi:hypothetical protein
MCRCCYPPCFLLKYIRYLCHHAWHAISLTIKMPAGILLDLPSKQSSLSRAMKMQLGRTYTHSSSIQVSLYDRPTAIEHGLSSVGCPDEKTIGGAAAGPLAGFSMQGLGVRPLDHQRSHISAHSVSASWCIQFPSIDRIYASSSFVCHNSSQSAFVLPKGRIENKRSRSLKVRYSQEQARRFEMRWLFA